MAKAKDLAALAALAGLAYVNRDALFGSKKDDKRTDARSPGDEMSSAASRKMPDDDRMSNEDYIKSRMKKDPEAEKGSAQSDVLKAVTATKEAPNYKAGNQGVVPSGKSAAKAVAPAPAPTPTPSDRRTLESGMSRGTRPAVAKNPDYSNEGRSSTAPTSTPVATTTKVAAKPTTRSTNILEEAKEEARRRAAASQTTPTSTSSSTSPVTRTPFPGSSAFNKKHGGAVKMASGGMTASRRGDGIASRGKTRGKIC